MPTEVNNSPAGDRGVECFHPAASRVGSGDGPPANLTPRALMPKRSVAADHAYSMERGARLPVVSTLRLAIPDAASRINAAPVRILPVLPVAILAIVLPPVIHVTSIAWLVVSPVITITRVAGIRPPVITIRPAVIRSRAVIGVAVTSAVVGTPIPPAVGRIAVTAGVIGVAVTSAVVG